MIESAKNRIISEKNKKELTRTNVRCMIKTENKKEPMLPAPTLMFRQKCITSTNLSICNFETAQIRSMLCSSQVIVYHVI